jgi:hypothetical protein
MRQWLGQFIGLRPSRSISVRCWITALSRSLSFASYSWAFAWTPTESAMRASSRYSAVIGRYMFSR